MFYLVLSLLYFILYWRDPNSYFTEIIIVYEKKTLDKKSVRNIYLLFIDLLLILFFFFNSIFILKGTIENYAIMVKYIYEYMI